MIVVTGAGGFIGSNLIKKLNAQRFYNIIAVDRFDREHKKKYLNECRCTELIERDDLFRWIDDNAEELEFIFHLGARTNTLETDSALLNLLNTEYSKQVWKKCVEYQIPLIYASSAATYGDGSLGFSDDHALIPKLKPLNAYAQSKHEFDLWALEQRQKPFYWAGLKFFNVYGPNEAHKGRMASMVYQIEREIEVHGRVQLFKSTDPSVQDGEQKRDFTQVSTVCETLLWLMHHRNNSGIYNVGTGHPRSFNDIAIEIFKRLNKPVNIEYFEMPDHLKSKYQKFTQASIKKITSLGLPMEVINSI